MYKVIEQVQPTWYTLKDMILQNVFRDIPQNTTVSRKEKKGIVLAEPVILNQPKYNVSNYLKYDKYNEIVLDFYNKLEDNFSHCDLTGFYRNFRDLTITSKKRTISEYLGAIIKGTIPTAVYYENNNTMYIIEEKSKSIKSTISHELLHVATTRKTDKVIYCGFFQYYKDKAMGIGYALNEGYTEYINQKYFNKDELDEVYPNEQIIVQGIEKIVGSRKMEELFFKADLKGLVDELSRYASIEDVMLLIRKFDKVHNKAIPEEDKEQDYRELRRLVSNIYLEKQRQLVEAGKISEEQYRDRKLMHADIYVNEKVSFDEGAQLIRKDNIIKVIDSNRGVAVITQLDKYRTTSTSEVSELVDGQYSYRDDYQVAAEQEHKRRG